MKKCSSENCDECFRCGMYYASHSPHYDRQYRREVISILCFYGRAGTYDAKTRKRLSTLP